MNEPLVKEAIRGAARLVMRWNDKMWRSGGEPVPWPEQPRQVSDNMTYVGQSEAVIQAHRIAHGAPLR